ncbi:MAG: hypothetical protein D6702_04585 [Planctomycetota bacterium]|nr:MAG: hypothetical protein D6702_04585 [Planctomycetota bacterium]
MRSRPFPPAFAALLVALVPAACAAAGAGTPLRPGQDLWSVLDHGFDGRPAAAAGADARSGQYRLDLLLLRGPLDADSPFDRPQDWRLVASPSLIVLAGQPASVSLLSETAVVADYAVRLLAEQALADPTVATLRTGLLVGARVDQAKEGGFAAILDIHRSEIERMVIQECALPGSKHSIQVQVPAVARADCRAALGGDRGRVGLFQLPLLAGDDEIELLAVRVYPVEEAPPRGRAGRVRLLPETLPAAG